MENGLIPDAALSHSITNPDTQILPSNARLNKKVSIMPFGWVASMDNTKKEWIQIDLGSVHKV